MAGLKVGDVKDTHNRYTSHSYRLCLYVMRVALLETLANGRFRIRFFFHHRFPHADSASGGKGQYEAKDGMVGPIGRTN
jgi:hypothetical protein